MTRQRLLPRPPTSGSGALTKTAITSPTVANDGCVPANFVNVTGKIVLVRRGTCGFAVKAANAQGAGAAGMVIWNNQPGRVSPTVCRPRGDHHPGGRDHGGRRSHDLQPSRQRPRHVDVVDRHRLGGCLNEGHDLVLQLVRPCGGP